MDAVDNGDSVNILDKQAVLNILAYFDFEIRVA